MLFEQVQLFWRKKYFGVRCTLIGIVPIFEFLKKWGHSDFQEEKKAFSFVNIWNWVVKDWS